LALTLALIAWLSPNICFTCPETCAPTSTSQDTQGAYRVFDIGAAHGFGFDD
jgi:hypothetical protein